MDSLDKFMERVRSTDFALLLISTEYLNSRNCMYEVLQLRKDNDYKGRMLLIINEKPDIYGSRAGLQLIKQWKQKCESLENDLKDIDDISAIAAYAEELKQLLLIKADIDGFVQKDLRMTLVPPLAGLRDKKFFPLVKYIYDKILAM